MQPLVLAGLAVALVWLAPGVLARRPVLRRAPRAALVLWQAVSLGGVIAALAVAPAGLGVLLEGDAPASRPWLTAVATLVSLAVLVRLLVSGHLVGTRLRAVRRRHREIVDVVGEPRRDGVRVLEHPTPTAYCIPGRGARVVLSRGVLDALPPDELDAVLTHERSHLRARHDLLLEFFTVLHESVPQALRSEAALGEVRLLVEALADRAAVRHAGELSTARALVAIASARAPEGETATGTSAALRLRLLATSAPPLVAPAAYVAAALAVVVPLVIAALAWTRS